MFAREVAYVGLTMARQWGTAAGLRRLQLRELNRMLAHCRATVPAYAGWPDQPLRTLDELAGLPVLTKVQLRAEPAAYLAGLDRVLEFHTSGTTGQRLRVLHDTDSHDYHFASCVRRFLATGRYRPTDRLSHLRTYVPPQRGFQQVGLFRRHLLLTGRPLPELVGELLADRPHVLIGYPHQLRRLLHGLTPAELARLRRSLRMVMTESELLVDEQRAELTAAFGVPVFDEYSSWETLNIYFECRLGGRHIAEDRVVVEILDPGGDPVPAGVEGSVVVTHFRERAMPLVRYVLGDLGLVEPEPCRCGRRFRTMRLTRGRSDDAVVLPSGARLYADVLIQLAIDHPGLRGCFVRQGADGVVRLHAVPDASVPEAELFGTLRSRLLALAGEDFPLELVRADEVPLTAGGKGRFVQVSG